VLVSRTACYQPNVAALRAFQPDVANRLERTRIPPGIQAAEGRDGTATFLIPGEAGSREWLGGSSMPGVSAEALFAEFQSDGQSVALPGILTGVEPVVILARLPHHAALFVVESDPVRLKLVFHVRDYAELLVAGRLVFIVGNPDETLAQLCSFFEEHPGYELPAHLLSAPVLSAPRRGEVQRTLEQAGASVTAARSRLLKRASRALGTRLRQPLSGGCPRVAVLGYDPSAASLEQARRIERALTALNWPHRLCIPDRPGRAHHTARIHAIQEVDADLVLFVNSLPGSMRAFMPESLPVASWLLPGTALSEVAVGSPQCQSTPAETVFASARCVRDKLIEAGLPPETILPLAAGADDALVHPSTRPEDSCCVDVAILADVPDHRPEACGITLSSHRALWKALTRRVERDPGRGRGPSADAVLDLAQRDCGTHLQDPTVRGQFLELLATRLAPAAMARTSADLLVGEGYRVALWGLNWVLSGSARARWRGPIPTGRGFRDVLEGSRIVLFPIPSAGAVQAALDSLAGGACVICHQHDELLAAEYPGLGALAQHIPVYRTAGELLDAVRSLLPPHGPGAEPGVDPCAAAREVVRRDHTLTARLIALVDAVRRSCATVRGSPAAL
jgi:hypothetical protein